MVPFDRSRQTAVAATVAPTAATALAAAMAVAAAMVLASFPVRGQDVPWDRLPNLNQAALSESAKERSVALMKSVNSYAACSDTVFTCVTGADPSPLVLRMAGFVVRQAMRGKSDEDVIKAFGQRAVSARPFKPASIDTVDAPCTGRSDAKVRIVAFADFECPYCRLISPILKKLAGRYGDRVSYCFKVFPVKGHGEAAVRTSKAAVAAHALGRFWELHDLMYSNFEAHSDAEVAGYAKSAGMDAAKFSEVRDAASTKDLVAGSKRDGLKLGVKSTPAIYFNGKLYQGDKTEAELQDRIEEELEW